MLGEAGHVLRPHAGAGADHQHVVGQGRAVLEADKPFFRIDLAHAAPDEVDVLPVSGLAQRHEERVGVGPERDVDRVRLEEEAVAVRDELDVRLPPGPHAQEEGGLEAGEAAAQDEDTRRGAHHS
jgi:hypothetical protein